jgi:hypothetical protein
MILSNEDNIKKILEGKEILKSQEEIERVKDYNEVIKALDNWICERMERDLQEDVRNLVIAYSQKYTIDVVEWWNGSRNEFHGPEDAKQWARQLPKIKDI